VHEQVRVLHLGADVRRFHGVLFRGGHDIEGQ